VRQRARHHGDSDRLDLVQTGESPGVGHTPGTAANAVLDLQRQAGNRSVVELLGGRGPESLQAQVQRDADETIGGATTGGDPAAAPVAEVGTATNATMAIPDLDLVMPIGSYRSAGGPGGTGTTTPKSIIVTLPAEALDPRITQGLMRGDRWATVVLSSGGVALTLRDATADSISTGGSSASLTLVFASAAYSS
jgi:hypothetical protein